MEFIKTTIPDLYIIQPKVFADDRGYFFESYSEQAFKNVGIHVNFVQDNQSKSNRGVLRGLHFQKEPFAQGKLVRVIQGAVWDVAVDLRPHSETFGQYFGIELSGENKTMFWVPAGFAHGFATLEDDTIFSYKCSNFYNKASEGGLIWNDPELAIDWKIENPILSDKDQILGTFKEFKSEL